MLQKIIDNRLTVRELDNEIRIVKGEQPIYENQSNTIVAENGPKIEVSSNDNSIEELDFSFLPEPDEIQTEPIEALEITAPEEDKKIEFTQPSTDFTEINRILKDTKIYTLKDAVDEIKNVATKLQNKGFDIKLEELDFENTYQVVIKIEKDK